MRGQSTAACGIILFLDYVQRKNGQIEYVASMENATDIQPVRVSAAKDRCGCRQAVDEWQSKYSGQKVADRGSELLKDTRCWGPSKQVAWGTASEHRE